MMTRQQAQNWHHKHRTKISELIKIGIVFSSPFDGHLVLYRQDAKALKQWTLHQSASAAHTYPEFSLLSALLQRPLWGAIFT
eukprot:4145868-Amphidinium_carterae.1